jgi:RimJ/RimL family protein N-acetyltransferase
VVAADAREPTVLETERLLLVPLDTSRAEELAAIYTDPEVARYIGADRLTAEGTQAQIQIPCGRRRRGSPEGQAHLGQLLHPARASGKG